MLSITKITYYTILIFNQSTVRSLSWHDRLHVLVASIFSIMTYVVSHHVPERGPLQLQLIFPGYLPNYLSMYRLRFLLIYTTIAI